MLADLFKNISKTYVLDFSAIISVDIYESNNKILYKKLRRGPRGYVVAAGTTAADNYYFLNIFQIDGDAGNICWCCVVHTNNHKLMGMIVWVKSAIYDLPDVSVLV